MREDAERLPPELLQKASLRVNDYAWRVEDLPAIIDAAAETGLANIGGHLQFRIPHGGSCDAYWVIVDTFPRLPKNLAWADEVKWCAAEARRQFAELRAKFDFVAEGLRFYARDLHDFERRGGSIEDAMWFVWHLRSAAEVRLAGDERLH